MRLWGFGLVGLGDNSDGWVLFSYFFGGGEADGGWERVGGVGVRVGDEVWRILGGN